MTYVGLNLGQDLVDGGEPRIVVSPQGQTTTRLMELLDGVDEGRRGSYVIGNYPSDVVVIKVIDELFLIFNDQETEALGLQSITSISPRWVLLTLY